MGEDGEEDAVHGGSILEDAHGPGPSPHFSESPFDGVGGAHPFAFVEGRIAPAGEQFIEVVPQAIDGFGVGVEPAVREAAGGGPVPRGRFETFMMACRPALAALRSAFLTLPWTVLIKCIRLR